MEKKHIEAAVQALHTGEAVVFPTETVYGLGADALNDQAVAKIFEIKNRPTFNPLIIHYSSLDAAQSGAVFNAKALEIARAFWPGPLTLILPKRLSAGISLLASAGLDTIGVRVPNHPVALEFLEAAGTPVAAPSANISGNLSPTSLSHVRKDFGKFDIKMLDGGPCRVGLESTIIDLSDEMPVLLRPGGITPEVLAKYVGPLAQRADHARPTSPGQLLSHYAPKIPVRLHATYVRSSEALLAFGKAELRGAAMTLNLSPKGDPTEAAANLFSMLHDLDSEEFEGIAVMPIPEKGLGIAINDRLRRAAQERPLR